MPKIIIQPPNTIAVCHIVRDEDWLDPLPRLVEGDGPLDLTGATIEILVRPTYDHPTLIRRLSTDEGTIVIDDAAGGLASIKLAREEVIADMPVGSWWHFCILTQPHLGAPSDVLRRELFRGPLIVHPGRLAS